MNDVPFEGVAVQMAGREWIVPGFSFGFIRRNSALLASLANLDLTNEDEVGEVVGKMCDIAFAALKRNYPELTLEQVEDMLDKRTGDRFFAALKEASGLTATGGVTPAPS